MRSMSGIGIFSPPLMTTRTDDRSRCSMPGNAMIALTIAGASHTVVTRDRSISSTTAAASNVGMDDRRRPRRDQRGGREVERADVVERPAGQAEVGAREAELDDVREVLPRQVGVGEHDALGPSGRARRVHQAVDVVGRRGSVHLPGRGGPADRRARSIRQGRGGDAGPHERALDALRRLAREVEQRLVAHQRSSLGVLEDVADLGRGEPPVDRHGDRAQVVGGEDRLEELGAVVGEQADDLARPDASFARARRPTPRLAWPSRRS